MTYDIEQGIKATENVTSQGYKVYQAAVLMANSANNLKTNIELNIRSLEMTSSALTSITVSVN